MVHARKQYDREAHTIGFERSLTRAKGIIELMSHHDDRAPQIVSTFVVIPSNGICRR